MDEVLYKWHKALEALGMTTEQQEEQMVLVGTLITTKLLKQLAAQNPSLTPETVEETLQGLPEEGRNAVLEQATNEAISSYLGHLENAYSPEQRAAFEAAIR